MKTLGKKLTEIVDGEIFSDLDFQEALEIGRKNSHGKIWLIGGFLYKNLAHSLYGSKKSTKDFDLVIEDPKSNLVLPRGGK